MFLSKGIFDFFRLAIDNWYLLLESLNLNESYSHFSALERCSKTAPKKHLVFALSWDLPLVHRGFREGLLRLPFIEMNRWCWLPVKQGFWQPPNIISSNQAIFVNSFLSCTCWNSFGKRTTYKENIAPQFFEKTKEIKAHLEIHTAQPMRNCILAGKPQ